MLNWKILNSITSKNILKEKYVGKSIFFHLEEEFLKEDEI